MHCEDLEGLMSDFEEIGRRINQKWRWTASIGLEVILKRLARLGLGPSALIEFGAGERMLTAATAHLARLLPSGGCLSAGQARPSVDGDSEGRAGRHSAGVPPGGE